MLKWFRRRFGLNLTEDVRSDLTPREVEEAAIATDASNTAGLDQLVDTYGETVLRSIFEHDLIVCERVAVWQVEDWDGYRALKGKYDYIKTLLARMDMAKETLYSEQERLTREEV